MLVSFFLPLQATAVYPVGALSLFYAAKSTAKGRGGFPEYAKLPPQKRTVSYLLVMHNCRIWGLFLESPWKRFSGSRVGERLVCRAPLKVFLP